MTVAKLSSNGPMNVASDIFESVVFVVSGRDVSGRE
jgi:hypothetical protein